MARNLIGAVVILWLILAIFAAGATREPSIVFLPLFGLYPGEMSSGPNYSPMMLHIWGIGAGLVFLILGFVGVFYKSRPAAVAFLVLFVFSSVLVVARIANALSDLH